MGALIAGVVVAMVSVSGAVVTAILARRSQQEANKVQASASFRDDFVAFVDALKEQVDRLEATVKERDGTILAIKREIADCETGRADDRQVIAGQTERIHILEGRVAELGG